MGWIGCYQRCACCARLISRTVAQAVTLHVANHCFSFAGNHLSLPGFQGKQLVSTKQRRVIHRAARDRFQMRLKTSTRRPVYTDVDL
jgi:hypothetical protein